MYTRMFTPEPTSANVLVKRYCYGGLYGNTYNNCYSAWGNWGRWVVLGGVVLIALLIFFLVSCTNARRRKKRGVTPVYGTGWMAPAPPYEQNDPNAYSQSAPPYGNNVQQTYPQQTYPQQTYPPTETYQTGANQGYYGQQNGIELQQPNNVYAPQNRGGEDVYMPPPGPPPNK